MGTRKLLLWVVPPYCGEFARWAVLHADWRLIGWVLNSMGVHTLGSVFIVRPAAGHAFHEGYAFGKRVVENRGVLILTPVVMRQVAAEVWHSFVRKCRAIASVMGLVTNDDNLPATGDTLDQVAASSAKISLTQIG